MNSIKYFREKVGLTQRTLALEAGLGGQSRIGNYESSAREVRVSDLVRIRDALNRHGASCTLDDLSANPPKEECQLVSGNAA